MQSFGMNQLHLIGTILSTLILEATAFNYKEAKNWGKEYSKCDGPHQSPILMKTISQQDPMYNKTLSFTNFDKLPKKLTITNTGHTVEMKADWSGESPKCSAGPLDGKYVFEKAAFHWARNPWMHMLDREKTQQDRLMQDMEMHMFFYKEDLKSFEKAQTQKGGLAVFNMGFVSGDCTEHLFDNLEKNLHKVRSINKKSDIPPFRFASIFDETTRGSPFRFYDGSLDYPPCLETVSWFIVDEIQFIPVGLIHELRKISLADKDVSNVRPFQALNKRPIMLVYNHQGQDLKQFLDSFQ